jgi:hypothetical protein
LTYFSHGEFCDIRLTKKTDTLIGFSSTTWEGEKEVSVGHRLLLPATPRPGFRASLSKPAKLSGTATGQTTNSFA